MLRFLATTISCFGAACSGTPSGAGGTGGGWAVGEDSVTELVFNGTARAWVNNEPNQPSHVTSVHWQVPGEKARDVRTVAGSHRGLLLAEEGLYFVDDGFLYFWKPDGGEPSRLYNHNGLPAPPVLDERYLYFGSSAAEERRNDAGHLPFGIQAFPRDGGAPVLLLDLPDLNTVLRMVVDDGSLYWVAQHALSGEVSIWRAPKGGGTPVKLYPLQHSIAVPSLYASGDRLYWSYIPSDVGLASEILTATKDGGVPSLLISGEFVGGGLVFAFDPVGPRLFGVQETNLPGGGKQESIASWPLGGGPPNALATCRDYCSSLASWNGQPMPMWSDRDGVHPAY